MASRECRGRGGDTRPAIPHDHVIGEIRQLTEAAAQQDPLFQALLHPELADRRTQSSP